MDIDVVYNMDCLKGMNDCSVDGERIVHRQRNKWDVNTGRHYIGFELDEHYFDLACERLDDAERT